MLATAELRDGLTRTRLELDSRLSSVRQVRTASTLLGDALLGKTVDTALAAIKRDVVAAPSLYVDGLVG